MSTIEPQRGDWPLKCRWASAEYCGSEWVTEVSGRGRDGASDQLVQFQAIPVIAISTNAAEANHFFIRTLLVQCLAIHGDANEMITFPCITASNVPVAEERPAGLPGPEPNPDLVTG